MDVIRSPETSVHVLTTRCYIPKQGNFQVPLLELQILQKCSMSDMQQTALKDIILLNVFCAVVRIQNQIQLRFVFSSGRHM
jgi:hypothetical protein